ncbi:protein kinase [Telmatobacter sp. DSM 110680]|uniref:Protein kinase n=1 Tax=Telmatobacter sp. DSM 110680 TaxID=3036704 RepID=A0AAU7DL32_9BACT
MIDQDRWKEVNRIFHAALDVPVSERHQFVLTASNGNPEVRAEVELLLQADQDAGSYLSTPLILPNKSSTDPITVCPGDELCGRFRILREIAEGGMGKVFEAFDSELGISVALKVIRPEIAHDPRALARFRQEVRLARQVSHPNVCRMFDIQRDTLSSQTGPGEKRDVVFLTMEFLPGETLAARISRKGAIPNDLALPLARQISSAIDAAHALGIIHRDLKPGNIMLVPSGHFDSDEELRAVITDFGLARFASLPQGSDPSSSNQSFGWPVGTIAYMSPEQLQNSSVSGATDLYAFGLVLFEMVAGRRAFPAENFLEGISERIAGLSPSLMQNMENLPAIWYAAIESCLRTNPFERPSSAAEVVEILDGDRLPSVPSKRFKSGWTRKVVWLIVPLLALIPVWYFYRPLPHIRVSSYKQLTHDGRLKLVAGTDGKWLYVTSGPGPESLSRVSVEGGEPEALPAKIPMGDWDVSQDGSKILVAVDGPEKGPYMSLWSVPINGKSPTKLATGVNLTGAFTPAGDSVTYFTGEGNIYQVRTDGTGTRKLASLGPGVSDVRMSPDGKVIRVFKDGQIWEMFANGSGFHNLLPKWHEPGVLVCGRWSHDGSLYAFWQVVEGGSDQLWALDERRGLFRRSSLEAVQLTSGPIDWNRPVPGKDGTEVYAMGNSWRGELSRIDLQTGQLQPFLGGIPAEHVAFSPDGKFVTYTAYPIRVLWKANRDGTHAVQLTDDQINSVMNPQWSPDGKRILFMNAPLRTRAVAYTVSAEGGTPQRLLPGDEQEQADPNWSPDGKRIVLTGGDSANVTKQYLRILDGATNRLTTIAQSTGLWSPRWSPDGRYIAALSREQPALRVFDLESQKWSALATDGNIGYPTFSRDGKYLYYVSFMQQENVIYRIKVTGGRPERIAELNTWPLASLWGPSFSLDPSNTPLLTREIGTSDIYSLQIEFK